MGRPEIEAFLTHLAVGLRVSASTQNQAFDALLFLYHQVLNLEWVKSLHQKAVKKAVKLAGIDKYPCP
jgi:hypothetical protein